MSSSTGSAQSLYVVASALAVGMKVGAIPEGAPAREFAAELGLAEPDGVTAAQLATRRALAASPDILVPSSSAFARLVEQLDAIRAGAGERWARRVLETSREGVTPTATWLRGLRIQQPVNESSDAAAKASQSPEISGGSLGAVKSAATAPAVDGSEPAEPTELTFDDDWTEEAEQDLLAGDAVPDDLGVDGGAEDDDIELDDDDSDSDDDGPLLTDEAIDDLLADDSVDLDDDWMEDKPAS